MIAYHGFPEKIDNKKARASGLFFYLIKLTSLIC